MDLQYTVYDITQWLLLLSTGFWFNKCFIIWNLNIE